MKFSYPPESRPLDGYTVKRAVKRGGFGEVYYAISDAGKEVALKLLRQNLEIELRGVSQCLNLNHPNLVSIHDIRTDRHGDHWIVMEYVSGPTLDVVLDGHPGGMPLEEVRRWLTGMAAGLTYLHERGLVHRDLKPANVFQEGLTVKIGDVGLSKFISESERSAQTQSVGTVHYMAPEVAQGRYGKEIDVYALAVILYEMLTGDVPFDGESQAEILMKHLTQKPDLSMLPSRLRPVLARALEKNPEVRTPTPARLCEEFVRALDSKNEPVDIPRENILPPVPPRRSRASRFVSTMAAPTEYTPPGYDATRKPGPPRVHRFATPGEQAATGLGAVKWILIGLVVVAIFPWLLDDDVFIPLMIFGGLAFGVVWMVRRAVLALTAPCPPLRSYGNRYQAGRREFVAEQYQAQGHGTQFQTQYQASSPPRPAPPLHPAAERWRQKRAARAHRRAVRNISPMSPRKIPLRQRLADLTGSLAMAAVYGVVITAVVEMVTGGLFDSYARLGLFGAVTIVGAWMVLTVSKFMEGRAIPYGPRRLTMLVTGAVLGAFAWFCDSALLVGFDQAIDETRSLTGLFGSREFLLSDAMAQPTLLGYVVFFGGLFALRRWWWHVDGFRDARFRVLSVLFTVFVAWVWSMIAGFSLVWGAVWAAALSAVVQLAAGWIPPAERPALTMTEDERHVA